MEDSFSSHLPLSPMRAAYGMTPLYEPFSPKTPPSTAGFYPTTSNPLAHRRTNAVDSKPCRYFMAGNTCPSGDDCTFNHGKVPDKLDEQMDEEKLQHDLPPEPLSTKEQNRRKGFFPIQWRVISGGVLAGGGSRGIVTSTFILCIKTDSRPLKPLPREALRITVPTVPAPSKVVKCFSPKEPRPEIKPNTIKSHSNHQRTLSIATTPVTANIDHVHLFSAESPGGL
ncbi:hypothetical protein R3P38DRAFT_3242086 [Favolaschia claudopus]|uniref:C3H1-type domain-containing protein n=1 Tax=Favolaschia claudopus TaxID=2862362 RepID=A0AAV9Z592_9AGAR